jgi:hypothetical protein
MQEPPSLAAWKQQTMATYAVLKHDVTTGESGHKEHVKKDAPHVLSHKLYV